MFRPMLAAALFTTLLVAMLAPPAFASDDNRELRIRDNCDPDQFPAGLCNPNHKGEIGIQQLLDFIHAHARQVLKAENALGWRFNPDETHVKVGTTLVVNNLGGETHTFTKVDSFSDRGCVDLVNQALLGSPDLSPACQAGLPGDVIPFGGTHRVTLSQAGTFKFQCFIHPWMRTTVTVESKR